MRIQESLVADKQIALELVSENGKYRLPIEGKDYYFPTLEKVHEAFLNQNTYDTIKLTYEGKKSYLHLFMDEIEVFDTKKALRQRLSQDSQGIWAEIRNGKMHYYVEERGWISTSYKEITEQECLEKLRHTSTMTKALGIGLGILALLPGAMEFARQLPIGTKEAAMGLVALNQKSPLLGAVGYSLLPKQTEAQAVGTEFQVNTYTASYQERPSIAPLNDGGFVIVWESDGQDGSVNGIYGQRYTSNGFIEGTEFQVNTYTTSQQRNPSIASLNEGGFVVTWESDQDGSSNGIFGQRYDRNGMAMGDEFQVNSYITNIQESSSIAPLDNGGFVITWQSNGQDGSGFGIYGQRYDIWGIAAGTEFLINTFTTSNQQDSSVAPLNDGGFIVAWSSCCQDGDGYGVYAQRYDNIGVAAGSEFQINTYTTQSQQNPSAATLNDGRFVVTWQSAGQDGDGDGIYGRLYDSSGSPLGGEFQISTYTTNNQQNPSVASLTDGGFVVTWESNGQDGSGDGIYGRRYDTNGSPTSAEFQINAHTISYQYAQRIAPLIDGGFVVTWVSGGIYSTWPWPSINTITLGQDGDISGIFGQRYNATGDPIPLQLPFPPTTTIATVQGSPTQNTPTPSLVPTQSTLTNSTTAPSNTPPSTSFTSGTVFPSSTVTIFPPSQTSNSGTTNSSNPPSPTAFTTPSMLSSTSVTSSAPGSNTQAASSTQLSSRAISTSLENASTSSTSTIVSVQNLVYEESYPIFVNDQVVGTYSVSGGTGLLNSSNSNVIYFEFDSTFQPEEGQIITLFYIPEEEVALWESIEIEGENYECLEAHGQVATNQGRSSYQMVFEDTECLAVAPRMFATALPLTLN